MLSGAALYFNRFIADSPAKRRKGFWVVKIWLLSLLAIDLFCGCKTSTIETRKKERYTPYSELSPELRAAVDAGQIKVGMPMDAVYIAWGPPSQILRGESGTGTTTTWLYHGTALQEHRYWTTRPFRYRHGVYYDTYLESDYYPTSYTRAEVVFENGVVKYWRTLQRPNY